MFGSVFSNYIIAFALFLIVCGGGNSADKKDVRCSWLPSEMKERTRKSFKLMLIMSMIFHAVYFYEQVVGLDAYIFPFVLCTIGTILFWLLLFNKSGGSFVILIWVLFLNDVLGIYYDYKSLWLDSVLSIAVIFPALILMVNCFYKDRGYYL